MTSFKDFFHSSPNNRKLSFPSVSLAHGSHTLSLKFDQKDVITEAGYEGKLDPWLESLCALLTGKDLAHAQELSLEDWDSAFRDDPFYWERKEDLAGRIFFRPLEVLHATLDLFRGKDYLYLDASPLICRCFGVRESDVLAHIKTEAHPTIETLGVATKAGQGCRSCVSQLKRWIEVGKEPKKERLYKDKPRAEWILEMDLLLTQFPEASEWGMVIESFRGADVMISHSHSCTQSEEEEMSKKIQRFLAGALDTDLGFFLRRSRHRL